MLSRRKVHFGCTNGLYSMDERPGGLQSNGSIARQRPGSSVTGPRGTTPGDLAARQPGHDWRLSGEAAIRRFVPT